MSKKTQKTLPKWPLRLCVLVCALFVIDILIGKKLDAVLGAKLAAVLDAVLLFGGLSIVAISTLVFCIRGKKVIDTIDSELRERSKEG